MLMLHFSGEQIDILVRYYHGAVVFVQLSSTYRAKIVFSSLVFVVSSLVIGATDPADSLG
jgi:hypothetical protein